MKKIYISIISIILVIVLIITITLFEPKTGKMLCTYKSNDKNMNVEMSYLITFKDKMVTDLKVKEVIESDDSKMLSEYKETLDMIYSIYHDLKHYNVEVLIKDKSLITNAVINYKNIDKDEFIKIDPSAENLYEGKKIPLSKLKNKYKNNGAKCRYV